MENYCQSFDQLPSEDQKSIGLILKEYGKQDDIMDAWLQIQDDSLRLYECLGLEVEKQKLYEVFFISSKISHIDINQKQLYREPIYKDNMTTCHLFELISMRY